MNKSSIFKQVQHPKDVSDFYHIYNKSNILNVLYWNEYFEMVFDIEGSIVECGVGRGRSLITILALQQYYKQVQKMISGGSIKSTPFWGAVMRIVISQKGLI